MPRSDVFTLKSSVYRLTIYRNALLNIYLSTHMRVGLQSWSRRMYCLRRVDSARTAVDPTRDSLQLFHCRQICRITENNMILYQDTQSYPIFILPWRCCPLGYHRLMCLTLYFLGRVPWKISSSKQECSIRWFKNSNYRMSLRLLCIAFQTNTLPRSLYDATIKWIVKPLTPQPAAICCNASLFPGCFQM